jgi:4-hydroxy-tetrahydrodipicolinate synthase
MNAGFRGCYTAIITPFNSDGGIDFSGLRALVEFQCNQRISGIVPAGTTGESPTLNWEDHNRVIETAFEARSGGVETIAGTGSNSTEESLEATRHAADLGISAALLVDPYYNGPSSLEIRREYYEPIARANPEVRLIPYVIPGRTGTQLLPQDLALLFKQYPNVSEVKEATGSLENARQTRSYCGRDFAILSGDDDKTLTLMRESAILASGVISVVSNITPKAVKDMVGAALSSNWPEAERLARVLRPLSDLVTVKADEQTPNGVVSFKARNPLPIKTMMNILGMPSGPCRRPLGKMTRNGLTMVLNALRQVWKDNPEVLRPIEGAFGVYLNQRISGNDWSALRYGSYY